MKNKIISILLSLAIALGLWVYVITVVDPEYERTTSGVEVVLQNEEMLQDRNLMIVERTESVSLRLKGNRTILVGVVSKDLYVQANVAGITEPGEYRLSYKVSFPDSVPGNAVTVQKQDPDVVTIKVEKKVTKEVPIQLDIAGTVAQGFEADEPVFEPETISITGPESVVNQVVFAKIDETLDVSGKDDTVAGEFAYTLCDKEGKPVNVEHITTKTELVDTRVRIQQVKELKLVLNIIPGGGLTAENVTIEPATIRVSGPKALLEDMGDTLELGTLDLFLLATTEQPEPFPIELPEGVENRSGIESAKVTIDFGDLEHKTLTLTKFKVEPPAGTEVDLDTKSITVTFRGTKEQLEHLTEEDVTVVVSFMDVPPGNATRDAVITVSAEFAGVEAVGGPYKISAILRRKN